LNPNEHQGKILVELLEKKDNKYPKRMEEYLGR
jgi:hypothetical protein